MQNIDIQVFGKVQGVFFRKFTAAEANKLKLVGWVMNTVKGTVKGQMQGIFILVDIKNIIKLLNTFFQKGNESSIKKMKDWLRKTGSPKSRIDRTEFKETPITSLQFNSFEIRK